MNEIAKPIAWLALLQISAVFLSYAGGILGKSWCEKVYERDWMPGLTAFYSRFGLWLLLVPVAWSLGFLIRQRSETSQPRVALWVAAGIAILATIGFTGAAALLSAIPSQGGL